MKPPTISAARLEAIRAAVALNPGREGDAPAYHDRRELLAEFDRLTDLLTRAEASMAANGVRHEPRFASCLPLVIYFAKDLDREEFIALMHQAKPNMTMRKV